MQIQSFSFLTRMNFLLNLSIFNVLLFLLQTSLVKSKNSEKWKKRLSNFPEECTTSCKGGIAMDFMLKQEREKCPDTINHGQKREDFIGSTMEMCNAKVRCLERSSKYQTYPYA